MVATSNTSVVIGPTGPTLALAAMRYNEQLRRDHEAREAELRAQDEQRAPRVRY